MGNGSGGEPVRILLAEDDDDDYFLTPQALEENRLRNFASSRTEEDAVRSYELGVNSFITKPVTFQGLVDAMKALGRYWFEVVEVPK